MNRAPGLLSALDLFVGRGIGRCKHPIGTDPAHIAERESTRLALVAVETGRGACDEIGLVLRVAGRIELCPLIYFALFTCEPCKHTRLDPGEVRREKTMARTCADRGAGDVADDRHRLRAKSFQTGDVAGRNGLNRGAEVRGSA